MKKISKVAELENENRKLKSYIKDLEYRLRLQDPDDYDTTNAAPATAPITVTLPNGEIRVINRPSSK